MKIEKIIKECVKNGSIVWKEHILEQMRSRKIKTKEIFLALQHFKIIETYYEDKPFPSFLVLGYTQVLGDGKWTASGDGSKAPVIGSK